MLNITTRGNMEIGNSSIPMTMSVSSAIGLYASISGSTGKTTEDENDVIVMTTEVTVLSAVGLIILILIGVAGNVMTILAYFENKRHNKVYDFYILNLALTDLLLCSISMSVYTVYTLMKFRWPFGYWFCKIFIMIDFTACTEGTLLMLILSLDRLFMISLGTLYTRKVTWKFAKIVIFLSWIISFLLYGPAILTWDYWVGYSNIPNMDCDVEFAFEYVFVITMSTIGFLIPAAGLVIINGLLFHKIWRWANIRQQTFMINTKHAETSNVSKERREVYQSAQQSNTVTGTQENTQESVGNKGQLKSAKFLTILVLSFIVFWCPYTITSMVISVCKKCVNTNLYAFFSWLSLMKSVVNPLLYALNKPRYRQCFRRYITLDGRICMFYKQRP